VEDFFFFDIFHNFFLKYKEMNQYRVTAANSLLRILCGSSKRLDASLDKTGLRNDM
jgi:hypothetical protein